MKKIIAIGVVIIGCISFVAITSDENPVQILPSEQRVGNADSGYQYVITGDYIKSGLPFGLYNLALKKEKINWLDREDENAEVRYDFNVVKADNGEKVVVPNCFQCMPRYSKEN